MNIVFIMIIKLAELGQHRVRQWPVAWWLHVITCIIDDNYK